MNGSLEHRYWSRVEKTDGCWLWRGTVNRQGYGVLIFNGRMKKATHVAIWFETGELPPPKKMVCHRCDNPACVRPGHLFIGSAYDNIQDCVSKGRHNLAKLTDETVAEARRRRANGEKVKDLAKAFGVSGPAMGDAVGGQTWRHVSVPPCPRRQQWNGKLPAILDEEEA